MRDATIPVVSLRSVEIHSLSVSPSPGPLRVERGVVTQDRILPFQWSVAVPLSAEELDTLRAQKPDVS
jgi:hypothetical protein